MRLTLIEAPGEEPLTAAEVKARLSIGDELSDDIADALITAARQTIDGAEGWLGRALVTQTWRGNFDHFPNCSIDGRIEIPLPPLQSIVGVSYIDSDGASIELAQDLYQLVEGPRPYIVPAYGESWPATRDVADAVSITFVAGYGDADDVPEPIKSAIALMVSHLRSMSARNLFVSSETVEGVSSQNFVVGGNAQAAIDGAVKALLQGYRVFF